MPSVVFYFQVHQPYRLKRYSVFDTTPEYFDDAKNAEIARKVADKCYRPGTRLLLDLVQRHQKDGKGPFKFAFSISGTALEQLESAAPDVIQTLRDLAQTGCCEFLAETYYHSLASVFSREEFVDQVDMHSRKVRQMFGVTPTVFRNTELIYGNDLATFLAQMKDEAGQPRFYGCLTEGIDGLLAGRSPNAVFAPPAPPAGPRTGRDAKPFGLLLRNYRLSDDIAFRFSDKSWAQWPLTAEKFAAWLDAEVPTSKPKADVCNLFMDFETFGEHQWADTGIFEFLGKLPEAILAQTVSVQGVAKGSPGSMKPRHEFLTPSEAIQKHAPTATYDVTSPISWADTERDLSAWRGNQMQVGALEEFFRMERAIKDRYQQSLGESGAESRHQAWQLLTDWRRLSTSDHFYYMSTKHFSDGEVHKYFSPYDSPYDAYINFMNVLENLKSRLG